MEWISKINNYGMDNKNNDDFGMDNKNNDDYGMNMG